jgi:hypothetical protein
MGERRQPCAARRNDMPRNQHIWVLPDRSVDVKLAPGWHAHRYGKVGLGDSTLPELGGR